jgi:hypothetical protein
MTFATALLVYLLLRFWACLSQSITPPGEVLPQRSEEQVTMHPKAR